MHGPTEKIESESAKPHTGHHQGDSMLVKQVYVGDFVAITSALTKCTWQGAQEAVAARTSWVFCENLPKQQKH